MTEQSTPTTTASSEAINHPTHYNALPAVCSCCGQPIECIDVVRHCDFAIGNAIKYLWRYGDKGNPIQDLRKAIWYIEDKIEQLEAQENAR